MIFTVLIIATVLLLGCFAFLLWHGRERRRQWRTQLAAYPGLARINRWTLRLPYIGAIVGLTVLLATEIGATMANSSGNQPYTVPSTLACLVLAGTVVGELVCFRGAREPGVAGLERRRMSRYLAWPLTAALALVVVATIGFIVWQWSGAQAGTTFTAFSSPDLEHIGSVTVWTITSFDVHTMAVLLLIAIALAAIVIAVTTQRPRNGADVVLAGLDDAMRRRTMRVVTVTLFSAIIVSLGIGLAAQASNQTAAGPAIAIVVPSGSCATASSENDVTVIACIDNGVAAGGQDTEMQSGGSITFTVQGIPIENTGILDSTHVMAIIAMTALLLALIAAATLPPKASSKPNELDAEPLAAEPTDTNPAANTDTDKDVAVR